nr:phage tail tape measure protein [Cohnella lubricantis]
MGLTVAFTAPIAATGVLASKAAIDFESAFAGVRKTVNATDAELDKMSQGIRDMSKDIPVAATEIAGVAEAAGQLGIKTDAIMGFTRTMVDLGVATNLSGEQAATTLARLANITQMSQSDFDRLGSTIVALGNSLATTEAEISDMALRLAGAGNQIGLTEAQILSIAGTLSSVGIEAEAGGTAFSTIMINMAQAAATGGEQLENFAAVAGMTSSQFKQAFQQDAAGALVTFIEGLGKLSAAGENTFAALEELGMSDIRVRDALLRASGAGDLFRQSLELGTKAWQDNNALTKEAEQRYATTASQLQIAKNKMNDTAITAGDALAPAIIAALDAAEPLIDAVGRMAEGFAALDAGQQKTIITIAAVTATAGPLLIVAGKLVTAIGSITVAVKGLGTALVFLTTNPIGLALTAIAGVTALVTTSMVNAKRATEELRQAQEDYQRVQQNGIDRSELETYEEKIQKLTDLKEKYLELTEAAKESDSAQMGNNVLALDTAADDLGIKLKDLGKDARSFGLELEFVDEQGKISAVTLDELNEVLDTYTKAVKKASQETATEISEKARQIATQNQEIATVENLLKTYNSAKQGSDEWKQATSELSRMFPQFTSAVGVNAEAIEGLMIVKQQEVAASWAALQVKANEIVMEKKRELAVREAAIAAVEAGANWLFGMETATLATAKARQEVEKLKGEISSLEALASTDPSKLAAPVIPTAPVVPTGGGTKTPAAYQNTALDDAYRLLEHKKKLNQLTLEDELRTLEQIKAKNVKTADERMEIEERMYDVRTQIAERSKDREAELLDQAMQKYRASVEDRIAREDLSAEQQFAIQKQMYDNIVRDNEAYLKRVLADDKYTAEEKADIQRQITDVIRQNINERLQLEKDYYAELEQQEIDSINKLSDGIQSALKERYAAEQEAAEDAIQKQIDANEKWRDNTIDSVKSVYDYRVKAAEDAANAEIAALEGTYNAQIKAVQDELAALEEAEQLKSRAELDAADNQKADRLRAQIEYEHDEFNKAQLQKELNKLLADQEARHQDEQLADKKDALKTEEQTLRDQLREQTDALKEQLAEKKEMLETEREEEIARINNIAEAQAAALNQQLEAVKAHYAALLTERSLQAEAEKLIIDNQQQEILKLLEDYGEDYEITGQSLGEKMYQGFKQKVDQISSLIDTINARIDAARNAAISALNSVQASTSASPATKSAGSGGTQVSVVNNFNTPVTSPSDVSKATQKTAQRLVTG